MDRLSAKAVNAVKAPGYYPDGGGLYLQVSVTGSKSWIFRYMLESKQREMGLGSYQDVSLSEARQKRDDFRKLARTGTDPIEARKQRKLQIALAAARSLTFNECSAAYIESHSPGWKNPKHHNQWKNTLETYCAPVFGAISVQEVDTALVLRALEPIWTEKRETAGRIRSRIERVLDWAKARGYREGENPARWKGHLDKLLPAHEKRKRIRHHPALPFSKLPDFLVALQAQDGISARALELLILTAARTNEIINGTWSEIDFKNKIWTIPAARMKSHREHRVPLGSRALTILQELEKISTSDFIFPGRREGSSLSNMAMLELLGRMGHDDITVHGFRSTFRDWASECTSHSREVCEMALAHVVGNDVEAAYRRGDLFDKRRRLMNEWEKFSKISGRGQVIPLKRKHHLAE